MEKSRLPEFKYLPAPAYAPQRDKTWCSEGKEIAKISRVLGIIPQPWQQFVWDRATEYRVINGKRIYRYSLILITVPRQAGKTTLLHPVRAHRLLTRPGLMAASTAQTGQSARKRIMSFIQCLHESPLRPLFKPRLSNGEEGVSVVSNGSSLTKFSPVEGSIHGDTIGYVDLDEIWKWSAETGETVMGAIRPTQVTLYGEAQIWAVSTMGTLKSVFMNELVEAGRAGTKPGFAYFEWSLPQGLDVQDPASWWTYHPALGNTISEEAIIDSLPPALTSSEFMRAYGNRLTLTDEVLIPADEWQEMLAPPDLKIPALSDVSVGVEIAPENTCSAIVAAWHTKENIPVIHVLHQAPGASWVPDYLRMLQGRGVKNFCADDAGAVRRILDQIGEELGIRRLSISQRRLADAYLLASARDEGRLYHDGSKPLASAIAHAVIRMTNGAEMFSRDKSSAPIPSLIASACALYADTHREEEIGVQIF